MPGHFNIIDTLILQKLHKYLKFDHHPAHFFSSPAEQVRTVKCEMRLVGCYAPLIHFPLWITRLLKMICQTYIPGRKERASTC